MSSSDEKIEENIELWKNFQIKFTRIAKEFPDNKIYATIQIQPELARQLIKNFVLIVNNYKQGEFESTYQTISISGFDIKRSPKVDIKIQAIPFNNDWKQIEKQSNSCNFSFTGQFISLSPVINFQWSDDELNPIVFVKWHPINDQNIKKYILILDNQEIQYINHQFVSHELETYIHSVELRKEHTLQIISKLKNGKEKYQSDLIHFTVPCEKNEQNMEILNIQKESIPNKILGIVEMEKEEDISSISIDSDSFRENAIELLEKLRQQIERREHS